MSHQREPLKTMSPSWRCYQAGGWTQTAGSILGRITQNTNSSENLLWDRAWIIKVTHWYSHHMWRSKCIVLMLLSHWQDFFPDHMVSISSETNGMVDPSQIIQVSGSFCLHWTHCPQSVNYEFLSRCLFLLQYLENLLHTLTYTDKYFSIQHRPFSTPALVQKYMDTSMPKNKAGSLGRSFISSCGGRGFIFPIREPPRSVQNPHAVHENVYVQFLTCKAITKLLFTGLSCVE